MLGPVPDLLEAGFPRREVGYARSVASTRPIPPGADRTHRLGLAALTLATVAMFVWLVASLAFAAFGS